MCLISKRKSPHRLKRDMRCWKVVYKSPENGRLKPIYYDRNAEYRLNATHVERRKPDVSPYWGKNGAYDVGAGFVHAYTNLKEAIFLKNQVGMNTVEGLYYEIFPVVCECVIPAGTEVYSNRAEREVCARKMRFDKILTP